MQGQNIDTANSWDYALENEDWIAPSVDIFESEESYYLLADMPGVFKENIKVKYENGFLKLMGRIQYDAVRRRDYILKESETGNYYRKFKVSDSIDEDKINAEFENGQLLVTLPKHDKVKPKVIDIL